MSANNIIFWTGDLEKVEKLSPDTIRATRTRGAWFWKRLETIDYRWSETLCMFFHIETGLPLKLAPDYVWNAFGEALGFPLGGNKSNP